MNEQLKKAIEDLEEYAEGSEGLVLRELVENLKEAIPKALMRPEWLKVSGYDFSVRNVDGKDIEVDIIGTTIRFYEDTHGSVILIDRGPKLELIRDAINAYLVSDEAFKEFVRGL